MKKLLFALLLFSACAKEETCQTCTWKHQQGHLLDVWYTVQTEYTCDQDRINEINGKWGWTIDGQGNNVYAKCECQ